MPVVRKVVEHKKVFKRWDPTPRPKKDKRKSPKLVFACDECGVEFILTEAEAEKRRFCSKACADADKTVDIAVRFSTKWEAVPSGCWEWRGRLNDDGYGTLGEGGKNVLAHRLSIRLFRGELPEGSLACHRCGVRKCVNPAHLYAGSHTDNMRDLALDNTSSLSRTSWAQRKEMVDRANAGEPIETVASAYSVSTKTVRFWMKRFSENDRVPETNDGLHDRRDIDP